VRAAIVEKEIGGRRETASVSVFSHRFDSQLFRRVSPAPLSLWGLRRQRATNL
jgi:hypothetical protein